MYIFYYLFSRKKKDKLTLYMRQHELCNMYNTQVLYT